MGTNPFVANDEMPDMDRTKLPKQWLSAAERLRRLEEAIAFLHQHLAEGPNLPKSSSKLPKPQALQSGPCIGRRMCWG